MIATYGDDRWQEAAWSYAYPSVANVDAEVIVRHDPNATLAEVRNAAAAHASGDWLCFLDADDQLGDGYLDAMSAAAVANQLGREMRVYARLRPTDVTPTDEVRTSARYGVADVLLVPAVQYVDGGDCVGDPAIPAWGRRLIDINCAVIGTLIPRGLFERIGGFRELPIYEDFDLWLRCVREGAVMVAVPDAVYCATRSTDGRNSDVASEETYWRIRNEHEDSFDWSTVAAYKIG